MCFKFNPAKSFNIIIIIIIIIIIMKTYKAHKSTEVLMALKYKQ